MKLKKRIAKLSGREVDQLVCEWCGNEEFRIDVNRDQITAHCTKCDYGIGFNRQSSKREGGGWGGVILETAKKNLKCPNGCGGLVEIKNPPAIDTELYRELAGQLHHLLSPGASANTGVAFLLEAVCPICGYVRGRDINEEELEKVLKLEVKK